QREVAGQVVRNAWLPAVSARESGNSRCAGVSLAEDQDLRQRQRIRVRDSKERAFPADMLKAACRAAVQLQLRRTAAADHLAIAPQHSARMAGAERFHCRLFRGKAPGEMDGRHAPPRAVGYFPVGEDPAEEPIAVTLDGIADAADVGRIEPKSDDVCHDDRSLRTSAATDASDGNWCGRCPTTYI